MTDREREARIRARDRRRKTYNLEPDLLRDTGDPHLRACGDEIEALRERVERYREALEFIECNDCDAGGVADHDDPAYDVDCPGDRNIRIARRTLNEGEDDAE